MAGGQRCHLQGLSDAATSILSEEGGATLRVRDGLFCALFAILSLLVPWIKGPFGPT